MDLYRRYISSPTSTVFGPLTAGTTYYILFDPETTSSLSQTFQINCPVVAPDPCANIVTINCNTSTVVSKSGARIVEPEQLWSVSHPWAGANL